MRNHELTITYPGEKIQVIPISNLIIYIILFAIVIIFMTHVLTIVFYHKEFTREIEVVVQPRGTRHFPYAPYHHYDTTLPYEKHYVKIKNGVVVRVERLGYAYQDKITN